MIDTHCHLTHARFDPDRDGVIARAREAGVSAVVTIGTGAEDARRCGALSDAAAGFVHVAAGVDPFTSHRVGGGFEDELAAIAALGRDGRLVAIGECGLDYHYDLDPRGVQADRFERQLELARSVDLPVVIHVREAHDDLAAILRAHPGSRGVVHSFTAGPREAEAYLELGWSLAFNGVATFKNAPEVREAARLVPDDRLLVETDAPYLAPVPHRGKRCEPAYVADTVACLARARDVDPAALAAITVRNAQALFRIAPTRRSPS